MPSRLPRISAASFLSDKEIKEITNRYEGYVADTKAGKDVDDVVKAYMKDEDIEDDPSSKGVEIMEDSVIGEELVKAINDLKEGQASYKVIGEGDTKVIYYFYKEPIDDQVKAYIDDAVNRSSVLQSYKGEEFQSYIDSLAETIEFTVSKAVNSYKPSDFEA